MTDEKTRPDTDLPVGFASTTGLLRDDIIDGPAGHLRNVLRRIKHILQHYSEDVEGTRAALLAICDEALAQPVSDGPVIDALRRQVGDLESEKIDVQVHQMEIRALQRQLGEALTARDAAQMRNATAAPTNVTRAEFNELKGQIEALRKTMISGGKTDSPDEG
jgi:polyhydroxyalkanoate synthesis regulator phasin